jgi:hypothetical protein
MSACIVPIVAIIVEMESNDPSGDFATAYRHSWSYTEFPTVDAMLADAQSRIDQCAAAGIVVTWEPATSHVRRVPWEMDGLSDAARRSRRKARERRVAAFRARLPR